MSPGPQYEIHDDLFRRRVISFERLETIWTGGRWTEGPAYFPAGRYLIWSDIPNDRLLRYDECSGAVSVFRSPSGHSNGNTVDRAGRLVTCEHSTRRVTRTEIDGSVRVIANAYDGKRLNSPNDVAVQSDGTIWFTDPTYGIDHAYDGVRAKAEIGSCNVYRVDARTGRLACASSDFVMPNGLAFSPDERRLYISDTGRSHVAGGPAHMRAFDVGEDGSLSGGGVFAECTSGAFDGFRVDEDGNVWASAADGVHCYTPGGELIGKILVPEKVANLVFGGIDRNRLFICATTSVYAIFVRSYGVKTFDAATDAFPSS